MADSSELLLESLGADDLVELASSCGMEMARDVLDQLERRQLIVPASIDGTETWTPVHLYLVALYFDAVTQIRHPWTSISSGMTVSEVSERASEVVELLERAVEEPRAIREDVSKLAREVHEFAESKNPIGELAELLDMGSPKAREMMRGSGRLVVELTRIQRALAALGVEAGPSNEFDAGEETTSPIQKPEADEEQQASKEQPPSKPSVKGASAEATPEKPGPSDATPLEAEDTKKSPRPPAKPSTPEKADARDEAASETAQAVSDDEVENVFAVNDATEVMDEDELAEVADDASEARGEEGEEASFDREGSNVTSRTRDLRSRLDNLRHEDKQVAEERGRDGVGVEESEAEDEGQSDEMAERIAELNRLREKYLAAQEWENLTELYEEGISLFVDPEERQQVYMTLAMLYEVKLNELGKALDRFIDAYMEEGGAEKSVAKALEGIRRVGRQKANRQRMIEWLEDAVSEVSDPTRRAELQREYALALHAAGEGQRAFYTYTSYLADAPRDQITPDVLDDLELLSEGVSADEVTEIYSDLIDDGLSDEVYAEVVMRAARHAADEGSNETAVELYEELLNVQPDHEVAFHSLAHLYEDTERWLELYQLYNERVRQRGDEAGPALTSELERVEEQLLDHADQITYRLEAAYVSGDTNIVDDFAGLYIKHQRYAEGYAFLNKFVEDADAKGARARAYLALAKIAVRHLHAPEEAALHYERALELGGPDADVLQDLARVRFDSGDWTDALMAVKALFEQVDEALDDDEKVKWLSMGVRAAEKADRGEDRDKLLAQLREVDPEHDLLGDASDD